MEEVKAAAYYEELTRKGEGAARFKRGLGFSSSADKGSAVSPPRRGSSFISATSSSSFLSGFVKASVPVESRKLEKEAQLHSIQNKLTKRTDSERDSMFFDGRNRVMDRDRDGCSRRSRRSRSWERARDGYDRYRDRDRERDGDRDRDRLRRTGKTHSSAISVPTRSRNRRKSPVAELQQPLDYLAAPNQDS